MSTGFPIEIKTALPGSEHLSFCRLDIDIYKNVPNILEHEKLGKMINKLLNYNISIQSNPK